MKKIKPQEIIVIVIMTLVELGIDLPSRIVILLLGTTTENNILLNPIVVVLILLALNITAIGTIDQIINKIKINLSR